MPVLDYVCDVCGQEKRDHFSPLFTLPEPRRFNGFVVKQDFQKPTCCDRIMSVIPPRVRVDAYEPGQEFYQEILQPDGTHKRVLIDSLAKLRQVERESERAYRNGEGQPVVWRDYSQDRSNFDVHSIQPVAPDQQPIEIDGKLYTRAELLERAKRFAPISRTTTDDADRLGDGAVETSPLDALPHG